MTWQQWIALALVLALGGFFAWRALKKPTPDPPAPPAVPPEAEPPPTPRYPDGVPARDPPPPEPEKPA